MTDSSSLTYYRLREEQETALAATAKHPAATQAHLEMARRYRSLAEGIKMIPLRTERRTG